MMGKHARRFIAFLACAALAVAVPVGAAQASTDPGWGGPDDPWPAVSFGAVIPGYEDVPVDFECPYGSGKALIVDIGGGRTYSQCFKNWHSAEWHRLAAEEQAAYDAVRQAAYEESLRLNRLNPGTQTCVPYTFEWQWSRSGTESGGICANPVAAPPGDDTTVTPGPTPAPPADDTTVPAAPTPAPPADDTVIDPIEIDPIEEPVDSITAVPTANGRWRITVTTEAPGTSVRISARHPARSHRLAWRGLVTDGDGELRFLTTRDLSGYRLRLVVGDVTVARTQVS